MKKTLLYARTLCTLAFGLFTLAILPAQDIHFSQFGNSPINLSPGLNGVFGGDLRFVGNYRNQWRTVPVPYTTFSGTLDNKFYYQKGRYDRYISGGVLLNYDRQGDLELTSLQIGIPISLTIPVAKNNFITLGFTPAFGQRAFSTNRLSFDAQWQDCIYDPAADTREDQLFTSDNLQYFDLGAGLNFRTQSARKRSRFDIGVGLHHINEPYHDFWSSTLSNPGEVRLQQKWSVYGLGLLQIADNVDVAGQALYQLQGGYREVVYGLGMRFHLNRQPYHELSLQVGANFRHRYSDAILPQFEVNWRTWTLGLTYDVNLSDFTLATNRRGGPEVSLIYRLYRVKPVSVFKSCPLI
ncbi:MAG: PorP/SprF family type IX secretion system membrane protein [Saprospiraceae bacterium]|nr:PorP/SprF family type IX secretion system membrane protein [Saprospiraceae bacterium]